jgi:hypothetical protein
MEEIFRDVGLREVATTSIDTLVAFRDFDDCWTSNATGLSQPSGNIAGVNNYLSDKGQSDWSYYENSSRALP